MGCYLGAVNVGVMDSFEDATAQLFGAVKDSPKASGVEEIFIPGEIERRNYLKAEKEGVAISPAVEKELLALAEATGIAFPKEM